MSKQRFDQLLLIHSDESREIIDAPVGFDWLKYPQRIFMNDRHWSYIGTLDIPHYREEENK